MNRNSCPIFFLLFFYSIFSYGAVDLSAQSYLRSYPLGAGLNASVGYSQLLWGNNENDNTESPWFGYVRPAVELSSLGSYNSGTLSIDVFPVSILGLRIGKTDFRNFKDYSAFDCVQYQCIGEFNDDFIEYKGIVGKENYFLVVTYKIKKIKLNNVSVRSQFIEPSSGLSLIIPEDQVDVSTAVVGYKKNEKWIYSFLWQSSKSKTSAQKSEMNLINVTKKWEKYSATVGLGTFGSAVSEKSWTVYVGIKWTPIEKMGLL